MHYKVKKGHYDQNPYELMLSDFKLMIKNCLVFNRLKDHVYKEANILNLLGLRAFEYFKENLTYTDSYNTNSSEKNEFVAKNTI